MQQMQQQMQMSMMFMPQGFMPPAGAYMQMQQMQQMQQKGAPSMQQPGMQVPFMRQPQFPAMEAQQPALALEPPQQAEDGEPCVQPGCDNGRVKKLSPCGKIRMCGACFHQTRLPTCSECGSIDLKTGPQRTFCRDCGWKQQ